MVGNVLTNAMPCNQQGSMTMKMDLPGGSNWMMVSTPAQFTLALSKHTDKINTSHWFVMVSHWSPLVKPKGKDFKIQFKMWSVS